MVVSLFRIIKFYCSKFKLNISPTPKSTQIHFSLLLAFNCGTKYKPIKRIEKKKNPILYYRFYTITYNAINILLRLQRITPQKKFGALVKLLHNTEVDAQNNFDNHTVNFRERERERHKQTENNLCIEYSN